MLKYNGSNLFRVRLGVFLYEMFLIKVFYWEIFLKESSVKCFFKKYYKWFFNV